jgi:hypothetical protein
VESVARILSSLIESLSDSQSEVASYPSCSKEPIAPIAVARVQKEGFVFATHQARVTLHFGVERSGCYANWTAEPSKFVAGICDSKVQRVLRTSCSESYEQVFVEGDNGWSGQRILSRLECHC